MMGDSPASARGVPITIGWNPTQEYSNIPIDEYEYLRPVRREKDELKMESLDRVRILKQEGVGYSRGDIQEGIQQVDKERRKRQQTRNWTCLAPLEEATETIQRFVLHSILFRSNHQQQRNRFVVPYQDPKSKKKYGCLQRRERRLLTRKNTAFNESAEKDHLFFDESKTTQCTTRSSTSMDECNKEKRGKPRTIIEALEEDASNKDCTVVGDDWMSDCILPM
jgi:hypothetical protein